MVENALGKKEYTEHNLRGQVVRKWGDTTYPLEYAYDAHGRMTGLHTYRGGTGWAGPGWPADPGSADVTTWTYDSATGLLTAKTYADDNGTTYTYDSAGRLLTRTWSRTSDVPAPGSALVTTYTYDPLTGDRLGIDYSDDTPDIAYTHNRMGRIGTVTDALGTRSFTYDEKLQLGAETIAGLYDRYITRDYDALGRDAGFSIGTAQDPDADYDIAYTRDATGRFASVNVGGAVPTATFSYSYVPDSNLLQTTTYPNGVTATRSYETDRNLITTVENKVATTTVSRYGYTNDSVGRRTMIEKSGTAFTQADTVAYGYNDRSEVTSADATNDAAYEYTYDYDPIGNRESYTVAQGTPTTYAANSLNQYTAVSDLTAPAYDADGNMTTMPATAGAWTLTWNAENRLVRAENVGGGSTRRLDFTYDYLGRRVEKRVYSSADGGQTWALDSHELFVYDGWNPILVLDATDSNAVVKTYTWGLDLSQSLQGAGGVGGLLSITRHPSLDTFYVLYDANGNVSEYLDDASAVAAHYEYSPFGCTTAATGTEAQSFVYRFSTKYLDADVELYYYGRRSYSPGLGRWVNRDPILEGGGANLAGFAGNAPVSLVDRLGMRWLGPFRGGEDRAPVYRSDTFRDRVVTLARKIGFDERERRRWLLPSHGRPALARSYCWYRVPNRVYIVEGYLTAEEQNSLGDRFWIGILRLKYQAAGFKVDVKKQVSVRNVKEILSDEDTHGIVYVGHGPEMVLIDDFGHTPEVNIPPDALRRSLHHGLAFLSSYGCMSSSLPWDGLVSRNGVSRGMTANIKRWWEYLLYGRTKPGSYNP